MPPAGIHWLSDRSAKLSDAGLVHLAGGFPVGKDKLLIKKKYSRTAVGSLNTRVTFGRTV